MVCLRPALTRGRASIAPGIGGDIDAGQPRARSFDAAQHQIVAIQAPRTTVQQAQKIPAPDGCRHLPAPAIVKRSPRTHWPVVISTARPKSPCSAACSPRHCVTGRLDRQRLLDLADIYEVFEIHGKAEVAETWVSAIRRVGRPCFLMALHSPGRRC